MIKMIKGTYGRVVDGVVEAMTPRSAPFELSEKREAELVAAGVAVKVSESAKAEEPAKSSVYANMKMAELRNAAAALGIDVSGIKSKKAVIAALETAEAEAEAGEV